MVVAVHYLNNGRRPPYLDIIQIYPDIGGNRKRAHSHAGFSRDEFWSPENRKSTVKRANFWSSGNLVGLVAKRKKKKVSFFWSKSASSRRWKKIKKYFFTKKSCGKFPPRLDKQLPLSGLWLKTLRELSRSRAMTLLFSIFADIALGHPHLNTRTCTKKPKILYFEIHVDPGFGIIRGVGDETVVVPLNLDKNWLRYGPACRHVNEQPCGFLL